MDKISVRLVTILVPYENVISITNDGFDDGQCSVEGKLGQYYDDWFFDKLRRLGHNCTIIGFTMLGSFADGTGVKGAMAKNLADVSLIPTKFYESDQFDYTYPIYDENLQMVCSYNYSEKMDSTDIIDAYMDFHWSYYMSLILTLIFFIFAWRLCTKLAYRVSEQVRNELNNARLPSYWLMLCAILDQDQFPNISRIAFSTLSVCFSLFFFITIDSFMMNMMSADLVSIEEPKVLRTYQDVLDRDGIKLVFFNGTEEMDFFKDAADGTVEHELWKKRFVIDSIDVGAVGILFPMAIEQGAIMIVRDWLATTAGNIGTTKLKELESDLDIRVMITNDETDKRWTNAFMYQKNVNKIFKDLHAKLILQYALSGAFEWALKKRNPANVGGSELNTETLMSSKLFLAEAPEPNIEHKNIIKLYYIYFTLIFIAFIVLLYEKLHHAVENSIRIRP